MKKYAICIPSSTDFALPAAILIYSLEKNFSLYDQCDVVIPYNDLSEEAMGLIRKAAPNAKFVKPRDPSFYKIIPKTMYGENNYDVYLSFEAFSQEGYEKTIYLDADMLCTGDFAEIMDYPHDVVWKNPNLGILVVDQRIVPDAYNSLIQLVYNSSKVRNSEGGDQKAVRVLYGRESDKVKFISESYNFQGIGGGGAGSNENYLKKKDDIRIIHYSGKRKPWGNVWDGSYFDKNSIKYPYLMFHCDAVKVWHEYYEDFKNEKLNLPLSPFEQYELENNVYLIDTPGSVDGLKNIGEEFIYRKEKKV